VSLHDLGLAARHCTRLVLMHRGRIEADGPPREVLSPERLATVFGIRAHLSEGPDGLVFQPLEVIA
jgi:iron complex transport system ATP-binding protein